MTFDIVIGNPPYNNDIYLEFLELSFKLYNKYINMVVPGKWRNKGGASNKYFRDNVLPYISDIYYYIDAIEVFDILESSGITYFLITKDKHLKKNIVNLSNKQKLFNNQEYREIQYHINNRCNKVLNKIMARLEYSLEVNLSTSYFIESKTDLDTNKSDGAVSVYGGDTDGSKLLYGYLDILKVKNNFDSIDKYKAIMHFKQGTSYHTLDSNGSCLGLKKVTLFEPYEICKDDYLCLFVSDNREEVESFISYMNSKLIRFLAYCSCSGHNSNNIEAWKFIPSISKEELNHIYTNEELYNKYDLNSEEIFIIEKVIKNR